MRNKKKIPRFVGKRILNALKINLNFDRIKKRFSSPIILENEHIRGILMTY